MTATPLDLAYAAGIFEGEGTVAAYGNHGSSSRTFGLFARVGMCDEEVPVWLHETWGGSICRRTPKNPNWSDNWIWTAYGDDALVFLEAIQPYLRLPRIKAKVEIGIRLQRHKRVPYRADDLEAAKRWYEHQAHCAAELAFLNKRGRRQTEQLTLGATA